MRDFLGCIICGRTELLAVAVLRDAALSAVAPVLLLPPLSLPLSAFIFDSLTKASSTEFSEITSGRSSEPGFDALMVLDVPIAGVEGVLLSWTVSSVGPLLLIPLTGVRIPGAIVFSPSPSSKPSYWPETGVGRSTTMLGVNDGGSDFRDK